MSSETPAPPASLTVVQTLMSRGEALTLWPRDVALVVLIHQALEQTQELHAAVTLEALRAYHALLETLDSRESQGADRRLNESLQRLQVAHCLARVDLQRLQRAAQAEYHLTPVGEALARWHLMTSRLTGEPLSAIFRAFISQLTQLTEAASSVTIEQWSTAILQPLQYALKGMLISIQHHQKELDQQHENLRRFVSTLLTQGTEASIQQCEDQLGLVIRTIADLQQVVLTSTTTADGLIRLLSERAPADIEPVSEPICDDLTKRLQLIAQWTARRAVEWVDHHHCVHNFLRTVVRVDRQRRVTEALKHAIAIEPGWTFAVGAPLRFLRMRDAVRDPIRKAPPRLSSDLLDQAREVQAVEPDEVPSLLARYLAEALDKGDARASRLLRQASETDDIAVAELVRHFPWLLETMTETGQLDAGCRDWTDALETFAIEEIKVTRR